MAVASVSEDLRESEPFHPGKKIIFPKKKNGSRLRSFQAQWIEDYPFLHYDVGKDALFCYVCIKAVAEIEVYNYSCKLALFSCVFFFLAFD